MKIHIQYEERCDFGQYADEEYGEWSESYFFGIEGASIGAKRHELNSFIQEEQFDVCFSVAPGDTVWTLWISYDTGNSFGRSTGHGEVLWVFKDASVAKTALREWEISTKKSHDHVRFVDEDSNSITLSNPASGYFEQCTGVYLTELVLE